MKSRAIRKLLECKVDLQVSGQGTFVSGVGVALGFVTTGIYLI
jgi:hypothetical protein